MTPSVCLHSTRYLINVSYLILVAVLLGAYYDVDETDEKLS